MRNFTPRTHHPIFFLSDWVRMLGISPFVILSARRYAFEAEGSFWHLLIGSPGRFFAVNEIKLMVAYTILNFDVKPKNLDRPRANDFHALLIPNLSAEILYRRRTLHTWAQERLNKAQ